MSDTRLMKSLNYSQPINKSKFISFLKQWELQSMVWPGIIFLIIFSYIPMYGIIIAFKNYDIVAGSIINAPWVGLSNFMDFLQDENLIRILKNTLGMNIIGLIIGFPITITFALFLNEITNLKFKRITQTISYLPHFLSWIIYGGIIINMLSADTGVVNNLLQNIGFIKEPIDFMFEPNMFWPIAIISGISKELGWGAIIYIAAIAGVDKQLIESAIVDGANRFQRMWHISLPSIQGTIVVMLLFSISGILNSGFDQIWVYQNNLNVSMSEVIDTYVFKVGIQNAMFSYSTAVGLFKSFVAIILLLSANKISTKLTGKGAI